MGTPAPNTAPGPGETPGARAGRNEVSRILDRLSGGDLAAADQLLPIVYDELRRLAGDRLRQEPGGLTLEATALVHEAYLRLLGGDGRWEGRGHFFGAAAEAMRRILIERARRRARQRHGGGRRRLDLENVDPAAPEECADELVALDDALTRLEAEDPQRAEVVKLRYFVGLTIDQTADAMGISRVTVTRHWTVARAWLFSEITRAAGDPDGG